MASWQQTTVTLSGSSSKGKILVRVSCVTSTPPALGTYNLSRMLVYLHGRNSLLIWDLCGFLLKLGAMWIRPSPTWKRGREIQMWKSSLAHGPSLFGRPRWTLFSILPVTFRFDEAALQNSIDFAVPAQLPFLTRQFVSIYPLQELSVLTVLGPIQHISLPIRMVFSGYALLACFPVVMRYLVYFIPRL